MPPGRFVLEPVAAATVDAFSNVIDSALDVAQPHESVPLNLFLFPGGKTQPAKDLARSTHMPQLANPNASHFILRDPSLPGSPVIAAAKWLLVPANTLEQLDRATAAARAERATHAHVPGIAHDRVEYLRTASARARLAHLGAAAYLHLQMMGVAAEHQRRGAAGELLSWGARRADELGVEAWVEASVVGVGAYRKAGFEEVGAMDWDPTCFEGVVDSYTTMLMLRKPRPT